MSAVTRILSLIEKSDPQVADQLLPLVYDELRKLAAAKLAQERPVQTLEATALVHEAYLRLVGGEDAASWQNRGHFFAAAAEAMRRILVENARRKNRLKHGGDLDRVEIELAELPTRMKADDLIALDEALEKLHQENPVKARLVTLRFFGGLTIEQASEEHLTRYRVSLLDVRAGLAASRDNGRPTGAARICLKIASELERAGGGRRIEWWSGVILGRSMIR